MMLVERWGEIGVVSVLEAEEEMLDFCLNQKKILRFILVRDRLIRACAKAGREALLDQLLEGEDKLELLKEAIKALLGTKQSPAWIDRYRSQLSEEDGLAPYELSGYCKCGDLEKVQLLFPKTDDEGFVLSSAIRGDQLHVVQYILANCKRELGETFMTSVVSIDMFQIIRPFVEKNGKVASVFAFAAREGNFELLKFLIAEYPALLKMDDERELNGLVLYLLVGGRLEVWEFIAAQLENFKSHLPGSKRLVSKVCRMLFNVALLEAIWPIIEPLFTGSYYRSYVKRCQKMGWGGMLRHLEFEEKFASFRVQRLFLAFPVPENVQKSIFKNLFPKWEGKDFIHWQKGIQMHCTVAFLGDERTKDVLRILKEKNPERLSPNGTVDMRLKGFSRRGNATLRMMLDLEKSDLVKVVSNIRNRMGFRAEDDFEGHITLARLDPDTTPDGFAERFVAEEAGGLEDVPMWYASDICLYSSKNGKYAEESWRSLLLG
jgi:2'-5' RNA ligase